MAKAIRILVADDHPVVRAGIRALLSQESDLHITDEAATTQEALDKALKSVHEVILLDISMPGRQGLEIIPQLRAQTPNLRVLVMSAHPEKEYAERCLRAGASGYLCKTRTVEDLVAAVRKVAGGGFFVSASLGELLASKLSNNSREPHDLLSDREFHVLRRLASGKSTGEVAHELTLSVKTVSTYRARLMEKLGLHSNSEIIRYGLLHRLTE